jgi:hypothetical protein
MRLPIRHLKGGIESDNCVTVSFSCDIEELVTPSSCISSSLHFLEHLQMLWHRVSLVFVELKHLVEIEMT